MGTAVNYAQRPIKAERFLHRPGRRGYHRALLGLLAAFGVLAFIFSAVSPGDDELQQEFLLSSKSKQCTLASYKVVSNLRAFRICTVPTAHAPSAPQFARFYVTARGSVPDDEIKARVCSSRTGDRSPPTTSS
jgi:hypothetical protein